MSTEGWIFMVGFRVFDVGLLIVWLVWFFRLRDDDDPSEDEGPGGGGPEPAPDAGPGGGGLRLPLGPALQGGPRVREHGPLPRMPRRRGSEPMTRPVPARVRQPRTPAPAHRRAQLLPPGRESISPPHRGVKWTFAVWKSAICGGGGW